MTRKINMLAKGKVLPLRTSSQAGFNLIELMIAVSVMGILAALALPAYSVWIQNTRIRTATDSIQTGLQKARIEAIKRNAQVKFELVGNNSAWKIGCDPVVGDGDGDGMDDCPSELETKTASEGASAAITVTQTPAGSNEIVFTNLGTVLPSPPADNVPFTQLDINGAVASTEKRPLRVMIDVGGIGRSCDPHSGLPSTDPRKCP